MNIIGKNLAVGTSIEDVISSGGTLNLPTTGQVQTIVSDSAEDDATGIFQQETATIAGTIAAVAQVETATVAGTIGVAGAGDATVIVTGALVIGTPKTIAVAVANEDTAALVAGKIRAALNGDTDITTNYVVSGATDKVILTAKVATTNDTTLNISINNGTCTGLTPALTSANTTAGSIGTGNATITVTSALVVGSPLAVSVPVTVGDNASAIATKVRAALNATAAITAHYTVSGATDKVILTAKVYAANDTTLNIASTNGTCTGITPAASSANTTAGALYTGAFTVEISGIVGGIASKEVVTLNGTAGVDTTKLFSAVNDMKVVMTGTGLKNAGKITCTAKTDNALTSQIEIGMNRSEQAYYANGTKETKLANITVSASNPNSGAYTNITIFTKKSGEVWIPSYSFVLDANNSVKVIESITLAPAEMIKISAVGSAASSIVHAYFTIVESAQQNVIF